MVLPGIYRAGLHAVGMGTTGVGPSCAEGNRVRRTKSVPGWPGLQSRQQLDRKQMLTLVPGAFVLPDLSFYFLFHWGFSACQILRLRAAAPLWGGVMLCPLGILSVGHYISCWVASLVSGISILSLAPHWLGLILLLFVYWNINGPTIYTLFCGIYMHSYVTLSVIEFGCQTRAPLDPPVLALRLSPERAQQGSQYTSTHIDMATLC